MKCGALLIPAHLQTAPRRALSSTQQGTAASTSMGDSDRLNACLQTMARVEFVSADARKS